MNVALDDGLYLSLDVRPGAGTPRPWTYIVELCGPDDEVLDRRQGRTRSPLEARTWAVRMARELRRGAVA